MTHGHAPRRSATGQTRLDAALTTLFEQQIHFNQLLGLKFTGQGPHGPTLRFEMRPELVGHHLYWTPARRRDLGHARRDGRPRTDVGDRREARRRAGRAGDAARLQTRHDRLACGPPRPGLGKHFIASAEVLRLVAGRYHAECLINDDATLIATASRRLCCQLNGEYRPSRHAATRREADASPLDDLLVEGRVRPWAKRQPAVSMRPSTRS